MFGAYRSYDDWLADAPEYQMRWPEETDEDSAYDSWVDEQVSQTPSKSVSTAF